MRLRSLTDVVLLVMLSSSAAGCVEYLPAPSTSIAPSREVRLLLTETGQASMAPRVGIRVTGLDVLVERADADSLAVRVRAAIDEAGLTTSWQGELLWVPRSAIAGVRTRHVSRMRSWLLATGLAAGGVALAAAFSNDAFSANRQGGGQAPSR